MSKHNNKPQQQQNRQRQNNEGGVDPVVPISTKGPDEEQDPLTSAVDLDKAANNTEEEEQDPTGEGAKDQDPATDPPIQEPVVKDPPPPDPPVEQTKDLEPVEDETPRPQPSRMEILKDLLKTANKNLILAHDSSVTLLERYTKMKARYEEGLQEMRYFVQKMDARHSDYIEAVNRHSQIQGEISKIQGEIDRTR